MVHKKGKQLSSISILECLYTIKQLKKLKDLIRHETRWAPDVALARPLKKLGINDTEKHKFEKIREKIHNLIPIAQRATSKAKVSTQISIREPDFYSNDPLKFQKIVYDLFTNYEYLLSKDHKSGGIYFKTIMDILDETIGFFKTLRFKKLIALLNPLYLIAIILRIPITILGYMGFNTDSPIVEKVTKIIMAFILVFILYLLGENSSLVKYIINLFLK